MLDVGLHFRETMLEFVRHEQTRVTCSNRENSEFARRVGVVVVERDVKGLRFAICLAIAVGMVAVDTA